MHAPSPPIQDLTLADGIGVADFPDFAIVLDVHNDRYTRLSGETRKILVALANGHTAACSEAVTEALVARGYISHATPQRKVGPWLAPSEVRIPDASALEGRDPPRALGIGDVFIVLEFVTVHAALCLRPLHRMLTRLPVFARGRPLSDLAALARSFDRARRLAPFRPRCLPDTLAFVRQARRKGHAVRMVFGVKIHPFEAHCWAQSGSLVLTDPLDRVRRFQPILAL